MATAPFSMGGPSMVTTSAGADDHDFQIGFLHHFARFRNEEIDASWQSNGQTPGPASGENFSAGRVVIGCPGRQRPEDVFQAAAIAAAEFADHLLGLRIGNFLSDPIHARLARECLAQRNRWKRSMSVAAPDAEHRG